MKLVTLQCVEGGPREVLVDLDKFVMLTEVHHNLFEVWFDCACARLIQIDRAEGIRLRMTLAAS